jgi:hypothetical protein
MEDRPDPSVPLLSTRDAVVLVGADPSPIVIGVQFAWALGLAAGALTYLARRRST